MTAFKAYDIRGRIGIDLDESVARRIGQAFAHLLGAARVVLGRDMRASSPALATAVADGLMAAGVTVFDLGLCGTEEMYFAVTELKADGGIMVTASHNPIEYNGMKLVQGGSAPLDADRSLAALRALVDNGGPLTAKPGGQVIPAPASRAAYVDRVLSFADIANLSPLRILVNAGNGAAGPTFDAIAAGLAARGAPLTFIPLHHTPDPAFPNGIPNPLLPENQPATARAVIAARADFGVAWDGDFDRCFLFDHLGRFIPGEYVVGLLAEAFLAREPGALILHDTRVIWNTRDVVARAGGRAVMGRTGHAYLKQAMRETGAVYGGEMSAHHYFRDFMACDSGMIPWLLVAGLIGRQGRSLADLVTARRAAFPSSGEINFKVADTAAAVARVRHALGPDALSVDETDGLSLAFADWRLNLRASNTEAFLRLNVEARGDRGLVRDGVEKVAALLGHSAQ
jgi:phosphomannomutase